MVVAGDDANRIPIVFADVCQPDGILDWFIFCLIFVIDRQAAPSRTSVLFSAGSMKIPGSQNVFADSDMAQVRMIGLPVPFAGRIRNRPDVDPAVSLSREPVLEFQFQVGDVFVAVFQVTTFFWACAGDNAVLDGPSKGKL